MVVLFLSSVVAPLIETLFGKGSAVSSSSFSSTQNVSFMEKQNWLKKGGLFLKRKFL